VAYQMAPLSLTFSDVEGSLLRLKPFHLTYLGKYSMYYMIVSVSEDDVDVLTSTSADICNTI